MNRFIDFLNIKTDCRAIESENCIPCFWLIVETIVEGHECCWHLGGLDIEKGLIAHVQDPSL